MNPIEAQARRRQRERRKKKMRSGEAGDYNVRTILHGRMIQPNKIFVFLSPPPHGHFPTNRRRRKTNGQIRLTVRSFIATGPVIRSARRDVRQRQQRHHTAKNHSNQPRETTLTKRHGHDLIHPYTPPAKNDDTTDTWKATDHCIVRCRWDSVSAPWRGHAWNDGLSETTSSENHRRDRRWFRPAQTGGAAWKGHRVGSSLQLFAERTGSVQGRCPRRSEFHREASWRRQPQEDHQLGPEVHRRPWSTHQGTFTFCFGRLIYTPWLYVPTIFRPVLVCVCVCICIYAW